VSTGSDDGGAIRWPRVGDLLTHPLRPGRDPHRPPLPPRLGRPLQRRLLPGSEQIVGGMALRDEPVVYPPCLVYLRLRPALRLEVPGGDRIGHTHAAPASQAPSEGSGFAPPPLAAGEGSSHRIQAVHSSCCAITGLRPCTATPTGSPICDRWSRAAHRAPSPAPGRPRHTPRHRVAATRSCR
jgi:hypothetical protein